MLELPDYLPHQTAGCKKVQVWPSVSERLLLCFRCWCLGVNPLDQDVHLDFPCGGTKTSNQIKPCK